MAKVTNAQILNRLNRILDEVKGLSADLGNTGLPAGEEFEMPAWMVEDWKCREGQQVFVYEA